MGQKTYYHNLTKGWYNENDHSDAAEKSDESDEVKFTFRGNGLVFDIRKEDLSIEDSGEHEWARQQFLDHFKNIESESSNRYLPQ